MAEILRRYALGGIDSFKLLKPEDQAAMLAKFQFGQFNVPDTERLKRPR